MILVIRDAEQENRWDAAAEEGLMQGKLIIPFHFHLDLMCQPYTRLIWPQTAFSTSGRNPLKLKNTTSSTSFLVTRTVGEEREPLLTVNLKNTKAAFHCTFSVLFWVPLPFFTTGNTRWQSSLSISHSLWVHQTAKTNTLIIATHW